MRSIDDGDARRQLNHNILKQCREQIGFTQEDIKKKIPSISDIEAGDKWPTYKQLDKLADLYQVPRWVFITEKLPEEYQYTNKPAFRKFKGLQVFEDPKIRQIITRVERYRDLLIEIRKDLDDDIKPFAAPKIENFNDIPRVASITREWLSISSEPPSNFLQIKEKLEQKSIFIFLSSKYAGWSHADKAFRGLAITDPTMPIIIINNSADSKKAQLFTLIHELGHILRGVMGIDGNETESSDIERWCDQFAGEVLMPEKSPNWETLKNKELADVKKIAKKFKVSDYACLVRLRQLKKIDQQTYNNIEDELNKEYEQRKQKQQGGISRHREKEVREQFGDTFVRTLLTAWHSQEITLHKVTKLFGLKRAQQVFDLEESTV